MTVQIKVPSLGESVTEATIAKWYKKKGDAIKKNEVLIELETDKVALEVSAEADGVLEEVLFNEGDTVGIGAILGSIKEGAATNTIEKKQEVKSETASKPAIVESSKKEELSPAVRKMVVENNLNANEIPGTGKDGRIIKGDVLNVLDSGSVAHGVREERVKMTRLRKRIAERL